MRKKHDRIKDEYSDIWQLKVACMGVVMVLFWLEASREAF
jgi:hypothetical protein